MSGRVNKVESPYNKGKFRFILSAYLQIRAFVFAKIIWRCFIISTKKELEINEEIRDKEIRVIGADGSQLGVMSADKALKLAEEADMDLVKIAPTAVPPVCKIMDYGKYRFEQQKKEKENKKNQKVVETKEVRLDISNDYEPNASPVAGAILTDAICDAFGQAVFLMKPAVARCSDGDTFDEASGKIIASAKHDAAAHVQAIAIYNKAIAEMKKAIALAEEMQQKHREKAIVCNDVVIRCAESQKKGKEK